jgi:RNA polymerase sigma factor (sigma-70 family)
MDQSSPITLLNDQGQPLSQHLARVLVNLAPKCRRQFPSLCDDYTIVDILEEAARKIERRERRAGRIERLDAYAWVTVRSVATSRLRSGDGRLALSAVRPEDGETVLIFTPSREGGALDIERRILVRQLLSAMRPDERLVCIAKAQGFSSQEIAHRLGTSADAVDKMLSRLRCRLRRRFLSHPQPLHR